MAQLLTKYFGWIDAAPEAFIEFPSGLPGFERERRFVQIRAQAHGPLVFLQSAATPELCFLAAPIQAVDDRYELEMAPEESRVLELPEPAQPGIGGDVEALVLLSLAVEGGATANLLAPVVLNPRSRKAVQAVRRDRRYSSRHSISLCATAVAKEAPCS